MSSITLHHHDHEEPKGLPQDLKCVVTLVSTRWFFLTSSIYLFRHHLRVCAVSIFVTYSNAPLIAYVLVSYVCKI